MTNQSVPPKRIFPSSKVDARAAEHVPSIPQTEHEAYKLAFQDDEVLLREDLRPVRFQLELLKPELLLNEANIGSTFVFYGSAPIPPPHHTVRPPPRPTWGPRWCPWRQRTSGGHSPGGQRGSRFIMSPPRSPPGSRAAATA